MEIIGGHEQAVRDPDARHKVVGARASGTRVHDQSYVLVSFVHRVLFVDAPYSYMLRTLFDFVSTLSLLCMLRLLFRHVLILAVSRSVTSVLRIQTEVSFDLTYYKAL